MMFSNSRPSLREVRGRVSFFVLLILFLSLTGCLHKAPTANTAMGSGITGQTNGPEELARVYGVKIDTITLTAGGQMLDLRYRIVDPKLAKEVLKKNSKVMVKIIDKGSGYTEKIAETHLGQLRARATKLTPNRIFFILFDNPHGVFKSGSEVSVQFGSVRVDGQKVESAGVSRLAVDLQKEVQSAKKDQKIPVIITFEAGVPGTDASREEKIKELQEKAKTSQKEVLTLLEEKQKSGEADKIRSFWISNSIAVEAAPDLILELGKRGDIQSIVRDQPVSVPEASSPPHHMMK